MTAYSCGGPRVGVGVLVLDDAGRVLLALRRRPPEAGAWSILGGRVELYERLEDCARREAREEAGIEVIIERLVCVTDHIVLGESEHWVSPAYLARVRSGEATNLEPAVTAALRWFDLDVLPEPLTMTARVALERLRAHG